MKSALYLGLALCLVLGEPAKSAPPLLAQAPAVAIEAKVSDPLQTVWPTAGKSLGLIQSDTAGKWIVLSADLTPVQALVRDGGKLCFFEGPNGRYAVIQILDNAQPIVSTIVLGGSVPVPPPNPDPSPVLTQRSAAIRDAALRATSDPNRADTAAKLSALYAELARRIRAGELKGAEQIAYVARGSVDIIIGNAVSAWQPFRDTLTSLFTAVWQEGRADSEYAKLFDEVSTGLAASVPRGTFDDRKFLEAAKAAVEAADDNLPANSKRGSLRQ